MPDNNSPAVPQGTSAEAVRLYGSRALLALNIIPAVTPLVAAGRTVERVSFASGAAMTGASLVPPPGEARDRFDHMSTAMAVADVAVGAATMGARSLVDRYPANDPAHRLAPGMRRLATGRTGQFVTAGSLMMMLATSPDGRRCLQALSDMADRGPRETLANMNRLEPDRPHG